MKKGLEFFVATAIALVLIWTCLVSPFLVSGFAANFERLSGYTMLLSNTTFNNATTATNTTGYITLGNSKTAFFLTYVEVGDVANMSLTIVPQIAQDDASYQNISFYDIAGGTTLQTSETIASNGTYYFWLPEIPVIPYSRINMVAANSTVNNTMSVQSYIVGSINPGNR